ncbi:DUF456 domain-containing protein [Kaistella jeonii]|uniref:DUF456 domain-containing protein n=1 Tax=Kaistella jeonii TaxID=266749 RepID=A0A0C1F7A9_9FLAO|nr:DUF456 domain-containing protein [Kaistella jeonii]KIA89072.1 hypothetical protein OA86_08350 [Kaistella jeonii]SFB95046.1 hypothetical protein SAMN05421876_10489 [Kaistella jeonii]VEI97124.1 Protein of uncharacterised function (DUF456) [Kaistella jeonii]
MDHTLIALVSIILLVLGIVGTFLPVLPGLLLSLCGLLIYKFGTDTPLSMVYIWIFVFLTAISVVLNYVIPARTTRKYGGTRWGSVGSVVGTLVGMFFIPIPFGFLIGMFLGVFVGELLHDANDKKKAWNSTKGAFIGFLYGTGFNFIVGLAMFLVVLIDIFNN